MGHYPELAPAGGGGSSVGPGAPTHYVDPANGSDSNSGASPASAWQTIGKLNATTFQPGDVIALAAGQTFSGANWTFLGAGTAAQPIWITRYGTGADPIISGQNARLGLKIDGNPYVFVDHLNFRDSNDGGALTIRNLTTPLLARYCTFGANAFGVNGGALLIYNCSGSGAASPNLSKQNGPLRDVNGIALGSSGRVTACTFTGDSNDDIWVGATPDLEIDHVTTSGTTGALSDSIQWDGNDAGTWGRYCSNYWVHDCSLSFDAASTSTKGGISSNVPTVGSAAAFLGGVIEDNYIYAPPTNATIGYGISASNPGAIVQHNEVVGFGNGGNGAISVGGTQATSGVVVKYNFVHDCNQGIFIGGGVRTNITVDDNQIINAKFRALWWGNDSSTGTTKRNRIWCPELPTTTAIIRLPPGTGTGGVDSDYNEIGPEQANFLNWNNVNYSTLAAYVAAAGKDAHSRRLAV